MPGDREGRAAVMIKSGGRKPVKKKLGFLHGDLNKSAPAAYDALFENAEL